MKCENKRRAKNSPRFLGNLKVQKIFVLSKTFKVLMKQTVIGKNISQNYLFWTMVHQRRSIQFIRFLLQGFAQVKFVTSRILRSSLSTTVFTEFLTKFFLFLISKISHLSKNMKTFYL